MRTEGWPSSPTVPSAKAVGSGSRSAPTAFAAESSSMKRVKGSVRGVSAVMRRSGWKARSIVAPQHAADDAAEYGGPEHAPFLHLSPTGSRRRCDDPVGET